jgi:tRNA (guanine37-N1)-methyltransferase
VEFDIMTLFPDMLDNILNESIIGRARKNGLITIRCHNIRDYSEDKHRRVDDTPYGGGFGMLMRPEPIYNCFEAITKGLEKKPHTIFMSPCGSVFTQEKAVEYKEKGHIVILCGHYEGVDRRIIDEIVDEEISIGDYVLTGGELPACINVDAVSRLKKGVLASSKCYLDESVASGILEYPQYTKPRVFEGLEVPEVLLSGDHKKIERYRLEEAVRVTKERRPDMLLLHPEIEESLLPKPKRRKK